MMRHYFDYSNRYLATFDDQSGEYFRSNVIGPGGEDTGEEPFQGEFPHLLDIGIKGFCEHGLSGQCLDAGVFCYQKGAEIQSPDMSLKDYRSIMEQCRNKVFQVALGGRGDADCHKDYEAILSATREANIIPNITTSGFLFDQEKARITKNYCGAAAVSWYKRDYTYSAIDLLLQEGVTTNIHYILSQESIRGAVELMETNGFPKGIRAVIFLLYKPVGYQKQELVLKKNHPYLKPFFEFMNADQQDFMMGFDSCLAPGVLTNCPDVAPQCIEPCESARYSAYISADMKLYPCSFVQKNRYEGNLRKHSIQEIWNGSSFQEFRSIQRNSCHGCDKRELCLGGCPDIGEINLCSKCEEIGVFTQENP